jgi:hypothetical protein
MLGEELNIDNWALNVDHSNETKVTQERNDQCSTIKIQISMIIDGD